MSDTHMAFHIKDKLVVFNDLEHISDQTMKTAYLDEVNRMMDILRINFARADLPYSEEIEDFFAHLVAKTRDEYSDEEAHFLDRLFDNPHFLEKHGASLGMLKYQIFRLIGAGALGLENQTLQVVKYNPRNNKPFSA